MSSNYSFKDHNEVAPFHCRFEPLKTFKTAFRYQLQAGSAHVQALFLVLGQQRPPKIKSLVLLCNVERFLIIFNVVRPKCVVVLKLIELD